MDRIDLGFQLAAEAADFSFTRRWKLWLVSQFIDQPFALLDSLKELREFFTLVMTAQIQIQNSRSDLLNLGVDLVFKIGGLVLQ